MYIKGLLAATFILLGMGFQSGGGLEGQQQLLLKAGQVIEHIHYSPQTIDDTFSKLVWRKYLETIDTRKLFFLQSDLETLKKYDTTLDNEIHGTAPISFVPAVMEIYGKRMEEARAAYRQILAKPFRFDKREEVLPDGSSTNVFPADSAAQSDVRRKRLKYLVLEAFTELQVQRAESKPGNDLHNSTDADLEKKAREKVGRQVDRDITRLVEMNRNEPKMFSAYMEVIMRLMDPHSDYFPPAEEKGFDDMMANHFFGIGAQLKQDENGVKIEEVQPGGPAAKSGLVQGGDLFVQIGEGVSGEMTDVTDMLLPDVIKLVRGLKGTTVRITFKHPDGTLVTVPMIRDEIVQDATSARSAIVSEGTRKIGYIFLPLFYDSPDRDGAHCSDDIAKALTALKAQQVDGIVFDLRHNGGGSLAQVIKMVELFIKGGPAVQVRYRDGEPIQGADTTTHQLYDGPLALLVDEKSASASEIFTAAIQDYHRGIIIGSTSTYGKGTVQRQFPLGDKENGVLKMTFQQFYRVSGGSTQLKGVTPDIVLPDVFEYQKIREKDNPGALPWDMVAPANYKTWDGPLDIARLQKLGAERIKKDTAFALISRNVGRLGSRQDKPISLDLSVYKADQAALTQVVAQDDRLLKLPVGKQLVILPVLPAGAGPAKSANYQKWLTSLTSDIYIDQACKVIDDMLHEQGNG